MGKFILSKTASRFCFVLEDDQGTVLATSGTYTSEDACRKGIASVQKNAPAARVEDLTREEAPRCRHPKFQVFQDPQGGISFRLKATNGQEIARGGQYPDLTSCLAAIEYMRRSAHRGKIEQEN